MLATILTENRGGNRLKSCCRLAWHAAAAAQSDWKAWTVDQVLGDTPGTTTCQRTTDRRATLPGRPSSLQQGREPVCLGG